MAFDHPVRYCPKCGNIEMWQPELVPVCEYCKSELIATEYILKDVIEHGDVKPEIRKAIFEKYIKDNPVYSEEAVKQREEKEYRNRLNMPSSYKAKESNKPKCPTCGSTNIKRITTANRAVSVLTLGILSGKIGKNYECLDCKAKW